MMPHTQLRTFEGLYLEDSYFLGMLAVGRELKLRGLFALTEDHPAYAPPLPGEQHCYREGDIVISGIKITKWRAGAHPTILIDPDASLDFGSMALGAQGDGFWVETEWFKMAFQAEKLEVIIE